MCCLPEIEHLLKRDAWWRWRSNGISPIASLRGELCPWAFVTYPTSCKPRLHCFVVGSAAVALPELLMAVRNESGAANEWLQAGLPPHARCFKFMKIRGVQRKCRLISTAYTQEEQCLRQQDETLNSNRRAIGPMADRKSKCWKLET